MHQKKLQGSNINSEYNTTFLLNINLHVEVMLPHLALDRHFLISEKTWSLCSRYKTMPKNAAGASAIQQALPPSKIFARNHLPSLSMQFQSFLAILAMVSVAAAIPTDKAPTSARPETLTLEKRYTCSLPTYGDTYCLAHCVLEGYCDSYCNK